MLRKFLSIIMILNNLVFLEILMAETTPFQGISELQLPKQIELSVVTKKDFDFSDNQGTRRYWKTTLTLKNKQKIIWQEVYREFKDLKWVYASIVPIRRGNYFSDLNGDGLNEIAILPWDFGMAIYRVVEIYTIKKDRFVKYGQGKYHFERGPNVLLGCPKCWKFNLDACKQCH